jgi:hypothetical protein
VKRARGVDIKRQALVDDVADVETERRVVEVVERHRVRRKCDDEAVRRKVLSIRTVDVAAQEKTMVEHDERKSGCGHRRVTRREGIKNEEVHLAAA